MNQDANVQPLSEKARFELVWATLRELKIPTVVISFSGEGDSGQIDGVDVGYVADTDDTKFAALYDALRGAWVHLDDERVPLVKLIEDLTDPLLTRPGIDWWNNDGGFGKCIWHVDDEPPRIELEISERIVTTESHSFELGRHGETDA